MSADDKVTADARELAERIADEMGYKADDIERDIIAAVLAPLVARAEAAEAALAESQARRAKMLEACKSARDDLRAANNVAEKLLAERDRLREEVERLTKARNLDVDALNIYAGQLTDLRAQLAAAREDTERLDWLEGKSKEDTGYIRSDLKRRMIMFFGEWQTETNKSLPVESLRDAIDAVRKEVQP